MNDLQLDFIYHFTKCHKAFAYIMGSNSLKFSKFSDTNDPWESQRRIHDYSGDGKTLPDNEYERRKLYETTGSENSVNDLDRRESFFLSGVVDSEELIKKKQRAIFRHRMWTQYGDNHKGVCFKLSVPKLREKLNTMFPEMWIEGAIQYENIDPMICHHEMSDPYMKTETPVEWFIKPWDYRDECEYRFIVKNNDDLIAKCEIPVKDILEEVILGCMPDPRHKLINNWCQANGVKCSSIVNMNGRLRKNTMSIHL